MLGVCAGIAALDGVLGAQRVARLRVRTPPVTASDQRRGRSFPVVLENHSGSDLRVRVAIVMPEGIVSERVVEELQAPPGDTRIDWPSTGLRRGDYELLEVHVETAIAARFVEGARVPRRGERSSRVS